jgi:hypothetical protein
MLAAVASPSDPVDALNARARAHGWTFTCDRHLVFDAPQLSTVLALWQSHAAAERIPARGDFSARDLKQVLQDLIVFDIVQDGPRTRFRCRIIGSHAAGYLGEMTGRFLDDALPPEPYARTAACYATVIEARCPLRFVTRFSLDRINFMSAEFIGLPLATDGVTPDMVMSVTHFRETQRSGPGVTAGANER